MTSTQIFAALSPELAVDIFEFIHKEDRATYKGLLDSVAQARKVRPVFIERLTPVERHRMLASTLARPQQMAVADLLLRTWLIKRHAALLVDFLDALHIAHEKGVVETLPDSVEDAALALAVESLLTKHPREAVAVYLQVFNSMNDARWANLDQLLKNDARLILQPVAATP